MSHLSATISSAGIRGAAAAAQSRTPRELDPNEPQNEDDEGLFGRENLVLACRAVAAIGYDNAVNAAFVASGGAGGLALGAAIDAAIERRGALSGSRSYSDIFRSSVRNGLRGARSTGRFARFGGLGGLALGLAAGAIGGIAAGEFAENFCGGLTE